MDRCQDYLSVTSNIVEEYTLLLALNSAEEAAAVVGGNTLIYFEAGGKGKPGCAVRSFNTVIPGAALLFRKDLDHEGEKLEAGTKEILSLNLLLAYRKRKNRAVLLVEGFEEPESLKPSNPLLAAANAKSYAVSPISRTFHTMY